MKSLLLLSAFLCAVLSAAAQAYQPFPASNASWSYLAKYTYASGFFTRQTICFLGNQDTTINSITYKKIYLRYYDGFKYGGPFPPVVYDTVSRLLDYYFCAIREQDKKLYAVCVDTPAKEILLWDFNINVGDTIKQYYSFENYLGKLTPNTAPKLHSTNMVVVATDSLPICGTYRKRFITTGDTIVEGLGADGFPFKHNISGTIQLDIPVCFSHNNLSYSPLNEACFYIYPYGTPTGINNTITKKETNIYPNPFSNQLIIDADAASARLTDAMGKLVIQQNGNDKTINTSPLPAGLYILTLQDKDGNTTERRKLIKE